MLFRLTRLFKKLLMLTPFEGRRRLPVIELEPLDLLFLFFQARGQRITIFQVGAFDGANNDPIHRHAVSGLARCILLEPNPSSFARLQETYAGVPNVTLLQVAANEQDGEAYMYRVKAERADSEDDQQMTSFDPKHLEKHGKTADDMERITVSCRSLSSLVNELGLTKIDVLQIDAEGFDAAVVRMALNMGVLPDVINFEHIHLSHADRQPLFDQLTAKNYLLGYDAMNLIAVQQQFMETAKGVRTASGFRPVAASQFRG